MSDAPTTRLGWPIRCCLVSTGIILPAVSCSVACSLSKPTWQSGQLSDYASMVLANTALVFSPFLAYTMTCLVLVVFRPDRMARHFAVRFGVYTGMIMALQFILVWLGAVGGHEGTFNKFTAILLGVGLAGTLVPLGLIWLAVKIRRRFGGIWVWGPLTCALIALFLLVLGSDQNPSESLAGIFFYLPLIFALVAAPFWALATYVGVSMFVCRRFGGRAQFRLADAMCLLTWLGTYMGTVRISVTKAVEQYAMLPTAPPRNCYICAAAAHGHPRIVRSRSCHAVDGATVMVNAQMQRMKLAELTLAASAPRLHALARRVYNHVGPVLARRLRRPLAADVAYLALKPAERLAVALLRRIIPNADALALLLYAPATVVRDKG